MTMWRPHGMEDDSKDALPLFSSKAAMERAVPDAALLATAQSLPCYNVLVMGMQEGATIVLNPMLEQTRRIVPTSHVSSHRQQQTALGVRTT